MKKIVFFIFFGIYFYQLSNAQVSIFHQNGIILNRIVNTSSDLQNVETISNRVGYTARMGVNIGLWKGLSLQSELAFTQKGFKSENTSAEISSRRNTSINYLAINALAKYTFGTKKLQVFVLLGPSLDMGLGGKVLIQTNNQGIPNTAYKVIKFGNLGPHTHNPNEPGDEHIERKWDFGIQTGFGLAYTIGNGQIIWDARYAWGLTNNNFLAQAPSQNRSILFQLGYALKIGKKSTKTN